MYICFAAGFKDYFLNKHTEVPNQLKSYSKNIIEHSDQFLIGFDCILRLETCKVEMFRFKPGPIRHTLGPAQK